MGEFGFERLDVYKAAIAFLAESHRLADVVPKGYASLGDQLRRAAISIPLNIAEGSGKYGRDQTKSYAIARGSALECAAVMEVITIVRAFPSSEVRAGRDLLHRIVAVLTRLIRPANGNGNGNADGER